MTKQKFDPTLRPVSARALKSVIDTLRPDLSDSIVLDLFCGSGRFGISSLEAGARHAVFVDRNRDSLQVIHADLEKHHLSGEVIRSECFTFLERERNAERKFDVVFADPPFAEWCPDYASKLMKAVAEVVARGSIFLVKRPSRVIACPPNSGFTSWKETQFGESSLDYFEYGSKG